MVVTVAIQDGRLAVVEEQLAANCSGIDDRENHTAVSFLEGRSTALDTVSATGELSRQARVSFFFGLLVCVEPFVQAGTS